MENLFANIHVLITTGVEIFSGLLVLALGIIIPSVLVIYVLDKTQTHTALRRNYPVISHFRYAFEHLGEFFRQYFFAMDRQELPFNRAQRAYVYRAGKGLSTTIPFGSTRDIRRPGSILFVHHPFPTLYEDSIPLTRVSIGSGCRQPYLARSIINISGMSYGAISKPAVLALSMGAKKAGCWMNTGEGGLSPYHLEGGGDLVFQIGTAKNGVRDQNGDLDDTKLQEIAALEQVKMFEIKLSQGAKPGKGGMLPGDKVTEEIAQIRGIEVGEDAFSPNRHKDISSNEELLDMISRVREVTGKPVGFKTVLSDDAWLDQLFSLICKRGAAYAPDFITLDGADGGTGAAPMSLIDAVGLSLRESLYSVVDKLNQYGLREQVKVVASGKMINPTDVAWALCVGADFVVSARGFMFSLGCIQALQCNRNSCPTGITTHDPKLQQGLVPEVKSERVVNYVSTLTYEVGMIAHACGLKTLQEFKRRHARVVTVDGPSIPLHKQYPPVERRARVRE